MPHTIQDLVATMETVAPTCHGASWDNVGLLVGDAGWTLHTAFLTIDLTMEVLLEAKRADADAVIAYHPPIFSGLKRLVAGDPASAVVLEAASSHIALYSPHTALDAAPGGMTDWLADGIGAGDATPLQAATELGAHEQCKVVTYVPLESVDAVRGAMGDAGAGTIGDYTHCSTSIENEGTFLGGTGSDPAVGAAGQMERVDERRLMMVSSNRGLAEVLAALRSAHPYEEPPVHVIPLADRPMHDTGIGRFLQLSEPKSTADIVCVSEGTPRRLDIACRRGSRWAGIGMSMLGFARARAAHCWMRRWPRGCTHVRHGRNASPRRVGGESIVASR